MGMPLALLDRVRIHRAESLLVSWESIKIGMPVASQKVMSLLDPNSCFPKFIRFYPKMLRVPVHVHL